MFILKQRDVSLLKFCIKNTPVSLYLSPSVIYVLFFVSFVGAKRKEPAVSLSQTYISADAIDVSPTSFSQPTASLHDILLSTQQILATQTTVMVCVIFSCYSHIHYESTESDGWPKCRSKLYYCN